MNILTEKNMNTSLKGSLTAKEDFKNEKTVCEKFNQWKIKMLNNGL